MKSNIWIVTNFMKHYGGNIPLNLSNWECVDSLRLSKPFYAGVDDIHTPWSFLLMSKERDRIWMLSELEVIFVNRMLSYKNLELCIIVRFQKISMETIQKLLLQFFPIIDSTERFFRYDRLFFMFCLITDLEVSQSEAMIVNFEVSLIIFFLKTFI